jgi:hypothetical protein
VVSNFGKPIKRFPNGLFKRPQHKEHHDFGGHVAERPANLTESPLGIFVVAQSHPKGSAQSII